jgi:hypothetical protein
MKKIPFATFFLCFSLFSCSKSDDPAPDTTPTASYMNMKAGSTWNYEQINTAPPAPTALYTLTSTTRDSTVDGKTYHVFTNTTTSSSEYYRVSGNDYFTFQSLPAALGGTKVENLYLKSSAAVGTSWPQSYTITFGGISFPVTLTNSIVEKGINKTVNGIAYTGVIHVKTVLSVTGVPSAALVTDIHSYYAPNYGLIENSSKIDLNYVGIVSNTDVTTRLKTSLLL